MQQLEVSRPVVKLLKHERYEQKRKDSQSGYNSRSRIDTTCLKFTDEQADKTRGEKRSQDVYLLKNPYRAAQGITPVAGKYDNLQKCEKPLTTIQTVTRMLNAAISAIKSLATWRDRDSSGYMVLFPRYQQCCIITTPE